MQLNSKTLLFLALVLLVVLAAGCLRQKGSLQDRFGSGLEDDSNAVDSNAGNQDPGNNTQPPLDLREMINKCRELPNEGQADTCLKALAVEKKSA
ncbi:MAG TPA: hypothetical protein VFF13_00915, partial [archaeon]|nr:hypothetical protein [archaeon]